MIKFFRRIRQRLLSENKFSKYLLYAIGEIVLVVIGILIALQINNWNEREKLKQEERGMLQKLQSEFEYNQELISFQIEESERSLRRIKYLLQFMSPNPKGISNDSLVKCLGTLHYLPKYVPRQGVLTAIIASGKINLISNDSLNFKLTQWPGEISDYEYSQGILYKNTKDQLMDFLLAKFPFRTVQVDAGSGSSGQSAFPYNSLELLSSMELETLAEFKRVDVENSLQKLEEINESQDKITKLIIKELQ